MKKLALGLMTSLVIATSAEAMPQTTKIIIEGATILPEEVVESILKEYQSPYSSETIQAITDKITKYYIEQGYSNSGAYLSQEYLDPDTGIVTISVLEGKIGKISINETGGQKLSDRYIESRLGISTPLNTNELLDSLERLRGSDTIEVVNARLVSGLIPGENNLIVDIESEAPLQLQIVTDNDTNSPAIGTVRRGIEADYSSAFFSGDRISASYFNSEGSDVLEAGYRLPLNKRNGTLQFGFALSDSDIVEEPFDPLNIEFRTEEYVLGFNQPISNDFSLGLEFNHTYAESFLLGERFALSPGASELGQTRVSKLVFSQRYDRRSETSYFGFSSRFNLGVNLFNATINTDGGPDSSFVSWEGEFAHAKELGFNTLLTNIARINLTPNSLLPVEQFRIGGPTTVRGFRRNAVGADNGFSLNSEIRLPVTNSQNLLIQAIPFVDLGYAWNNENSLSLEDQFLASFGLGLNLRLGGFNARLDYGIPLVDIENQGDSLQEEGFYFSLSNRF